MAIPQGHAKWLASYGGLYVRLALWHTVSMPKRTTRRRKDKATEWTIGQPLNFPPKAEVKEPSKRPPSKTLDNKRTAGS
jgi:hypothetical protein